MSEKQLREKLIDNFNSHNKQIFDHKINKSKNIFLIEFNGWAVIHIIFSYLVNYFKKEKNCRIVAYEAHDLMNRLDPPKISKYLWKLGSYFNVRTFKIFKMFGTDEFIKPKFKNAYFNKSKYICDLFYSNKPSLRKLESFKINNVWIGDLIYDSYLKKFSLPTLDLNTPEFKNFFKKSLMLFFFWEEYFKKNHIKGICVCHAVYLTGIPLRIANSRKIRCFSASNMNLYNLSSSINYKKKINGSDIEFKYYKKYFKKFPKETQKKKIMIGKDIIKDILVGKRKYFYLKKKTYTNIKYKKVKNTKKINIVIFSHNFVDSPHIHGNHFFSDFKQWFNFLQSIIEKTDYNWYIKDHPTSNEITKNEINNFLQKNQKIKYLSKNFTNNKLLKLGIDYVLTVYGSIASEMPAYGINVISASKNNPHINHSFSINPKNLKDYKKILMNLNKYNKKINLTDLYRFHFMKYFLFKNNLFFCDPEKYFIFNKKKPLQFTPKMYEYWLKEFNLNHHKKIIKNLSEFINSKEYIYFKNEIN